MPRYLFALILALPILAQADVSGKVVGVSDGDTLTVLDATNRQHKIRLAGIDAPEKRQWFGQNSKEALSDCAFSQMAEVEGHKVDRYGRLVGKVLVDGVDCNARQIELGLAWHYKKYQKEQSPPDRDRYSAAEAQARMKRVGLWSQTDPMPPWVFRHPEAE